MCADLSFSFQFLVQFDSKYKNITAVVIAKLNLNKVRYKDALNIMGIR